MRCISLRFPEKLRNIRLFPPMERERGGLADQPRNPEEFKSPVLDPVLEKTEREEREREASKRVFLALERTLSQLEGLVNQRLDEWAPYVLELGLRLAEDVLEREIQAGNYDLVQTIRNSLSEATCGGEGTLMVYLNPQDLNVVLERLGTTEAGGPIEPPKNVEFKMDPALQPGACRIESNHGRMIHDPRTTLNEMVQKIRGEIGA